VALSVNGEGYYRMRRAH